jgi:hypothetical protein
MNVLFTFALAAILALPPALVAQGAIASSPSQDPRGLFSNTVPQQPDNGSKKGKRNMAKPKKVKKSSCVSPPPGSGLEDYCKNPYWAPITDWNYIQSNQSGGW